jgi:putative nucleotidyltransferase with HDIG domain
MTSAKLPTSIFSQKLDRIVFTAYFLGAVVPLVALAFVAEHFVLPSVGDRLASVGLIALVVSIATLSLASFLVLRRTTHKTLDQMDRDNRHLESLLKASGAFANALHGAEAAATAVRCALELTEADAVYAFVRPNRSKPPHVLESLGNGAEKLLQKFGGPFTKLVNLAMSEGRAALRGPGKGDEAGWGDTAAAALPLSGEHEPMGALVAVQTGTREPFRTSEVGALDNLAALASVSLRNSDLRDAQRNFFAHMTELVVSALDGHTLQQGGHGNRVAQYANRVGRELQLDDACLHRLHFASLLHDIGLLKIDRSLLANAKVCEKHPQIGARMLERIRLWEDVAPIVLHHHERFDGTGYPDCLKQDEIPLEARIISVCESFDVMISDSSYKVAVDVPDALDELAACAGTQFDPEIVQVFASLVQHGVIDPITG